MTSEATPVKAAEKDQAGPSCDSVLCSECSESVPLSSLASHVSSAHSVPASAWECGSCSSSQPSLALLTEHCFARRHSLRGARSVLLARLAELQDAAEERRERELGALADSDSAAEAQSSAESHAPPEQPLREVKAEPLDEEELAEDADPPLTFAAAEGLEGTSQSSARLSQTSPPHSQTSPSLSLVAEFRKRRSGRARPADASPPLKLPKAEPNEEAEEAQPDWLDVAKLRREGTILGDVAKRRRQKGGNFDEFVGQWADFLVCDALNDLGKLSPRERRLLLGRELLGPLWTAYFPKKLTATLSSIASTAAAKALVLGAGDVGTFSALVLPPTDLKDRVEAQGKLVFHPGAEARRGSARRLLEALLVGLGRRSREEQRLLLHFFYLYWEAFFPGAINLTRLLLPFKLY